MKNISYLIVAVLVILAPAIASAGPYLICTCQDNVEQYVVNLDGTVTTVDAVVAECTNGQKRLSFDLTGISDGAHNVSVKAKNIWEESAATPFAFDKSAPGAASNIGLSVNP